MDKYSGMNKLGTRNERVTFTHFVRAEIRDDSEPVKLVAPPKRRFMGVLARFCVAAAIVAALFGMKVSGNARLTFAAERVKQAICYDLSEDEKVEDAVSKLFDKE